MQFSRNGLLRVGGSAFPAFRIRNGPGIEVALLQAVFLQSADQRAACEPQDTRGLGLVPVGSRQGAHEALAFPAIPLFALGASAVHRC